MATQHKILLLDDDEEMLELYRDLLTQLPSTPEVHTATSGTRAIAMLDSERFDLLISDLRMPKMDGLQVLSIVRRKFPQLRIVILTSVEDEEYRNRAYAQGVELFWQKPGNAEEIVLFQDCIQGLLEQAAKTQQGGFRGVQSKSLVDIIQLECLSHSSSVLRIVQGSKEGRIWAQDGDIIDAATGSLIGEEAFKAILAWKGGHFEVMPGEPAHPRTIMNSYQGLLLDSAQAMDEAQGAQQATQEAGDTTQRSPAAALSKFDGIEFVLLLSPDENIKPDAWGLENVERMTTMARDTYKHLDELGARMTTGDLTYVSGRGFQRHWGLTGKEGKGILCVGFRHSLSAEQVLDSFKQIINQWAS